MQLDDDSRRDAPVGQAHVVTRSLVAAAGFAFVLMSLAGAPTGPILIGTVLASAWIVWRAVAKRS